MFLLNQDEPLGLHITVLSKKNTEIKWFEHDFYKYPEIPASYGNGAIDERVTPVYNFLSLYTKPAESVNDDNILIFGSKDIWTSQFLFNFHGNYSAIVCFDKESPTVEFYDRIQPNEDNKDQAVVDEPYIIGDLLYKRTLEYNKAFIYNTKDIHLKTNMSCYQVFCFVEP